ncbi:MAG TPA: serine/threonine-protein kinase [Polyangiaceae bacterium]|nr:serine/threonine-protein kinase [Polyangiaceae bacterium]
MKSCPTCQRVFPNDAGFCPADGTALAAASMAPAAPSADDVRIGTRLCGRYELRRVVADGGMGRVYEGIDKQTDSRIAVKMLHEDVAKDEIALERFRREYEINASLPHEHIVKVLAFEHDMVSQARILVMEFLDGEELRYILKREKVLAPERLVRMISQVAIGLDEAHARGFIHRDLKPDNLFLCGTREGDVIKLLDFGSVKDTGNNRKKLTMLGTTIGSPYYMAPEQAQGLETIDSRADVFALAAVVYECATGEVPFGGTNGPSILLSILTKDPVPPTVRGAGAKYPIAPAMDDVLEVALAKNPAIRTKSVGALADAVGAAYGLTGDHRQWAVVPQQDLAAQIAEAMPRLMAAKVAPLGEAADPFAMPPAGSAQLEQGMAQAFAAVREADLAANVPAGAPTGKPGWLLPLIVGVLALLVGGAVTLVVMMGR